MTLEDAITHIEQQMKNLHIATEYEQALNYLCWLKELKVLRENILPRPVIRDKSGKLIKDYTPRDWYLKLPEKYFEIVAEFHDEFLKYNDVGLKNALFSETAEKLADVITVCISYLESLGYDENKRSELFAKVNEKNEKRGYFKENDSNGD